MTTIETTTSLRARVLEAYTQSVHEEAENHRAYMLDQARRAADGVKARLSVLGDVTNVRLVPSDYAIAALLPVAPNAELPPWEQPYMATVEDLTFVAYPDSRETVWVVNYCGKCGREWIAPIRGGLRGDYIGAALAEDHDCDKPTPEPEPEPAPKPRRRPDYDLRLNSRNGDEETYQDAAAFEVARLLSVIAERLDTIADRLPSAGQGF